MANLGNVWHIPAGPEPRGRGGMLDPVGAIVPGADVTVVTGNQFRGPGGNPGNQLQNGSTLFVRRQGDPQWTASPLTFLRTDGNNKYYRGRVDTEKLQPGDVVQYYFRIAYDDHDTTFLGAAGTSAADEPAPFTFTLRDPAVHGRWDPVFALPDVGIHAHVLPDGRVLQWGRRPHPDDSLDIQESRPYVWDPATNTTHFTPPPARADGTKVNLFCSGHVFLPDGRLLVVGGHHADGDGLDQAALFDWRTGTWSASATMAARRWYPTAIALPDGGVLVMSGSFVDPGRPPGAQTVVADLLEIWRDDVWTTIDRGDGTPLNFVNPPLFPRLHVAADGRVFMSGTNETTQLLTTTRPGGWTVVGARAAGQRDYCPSVLYDRDRVVYLGGGIDPTDRVETIDLGQAAPAWRPAAPMHFPRRQHNAVLLPDGQILVTGGTGGGGGPNGGFNDLGAGEPVHTSEMWDPVSGRWSVLAAESVDRCYHGTAVLLPDARVLSSGGGEYRPDNANPNDPLDSHRDAQVFSPPYLFRGPRPSITAAPDEVGYGEEFPVGVAQPADVARVSWVRLPSVTHSCDQNQRSNVLTFRVEQQRLLVTAPASADECPPGHYMLFVLDGAGVPSVARTVRIAAAPAQLQALAAVAPPDASLLPTVDVREAEVSRSAHGTAVTVGITGTCPYGIGACWGGAYEALSGLAGVDLVGPVPNVADSTALVYLDDHGLPDLGAWDREFTRTVHGSYHLTGVSVTLRGRVRLLGGGPVLESDGVRPRVALETTRPLSDGEGIEVTGALSQDGDGYRLTE